MISGYCRYFLPKSFFANSYEGVRGKRKLVAYSDGSGRILCQCINLGNTIGQGGGGQMGEVSNKVVVTCGCGRIRMEKRFGIGGFFGKRNEDGNLAELNFAIRYLA